MYDNKLVIYSNKKNASTSIVYVYVTSTINCPNAINELLSCSGIQLLLKVFQTSCQKREEIDC